MELSTRSTVLIYNCYLENCMCTHQYQ